MGGPPQTQQLALLQIVAENNAGGKTVEAPLDLGEHLIIFVDAVLQHIPMVAEKHQLIIGLVAEGFVDKAFPQQQVDLDGGQVLAGGQLDKLDNVRFQEPHGSQHNQVFLIFKVFVEHGAGASGPFGDFADGDAFNALLL